MIYRLNTRGIEKSMPHVVIVQKSRLDPSEISDLSHRAKKSDYSMSGPNSSPQAVFLACRANTPKPVISPRDSPSS